MKNLVMSTDMVPSVKRLHRHIRKLNSAYMESENKQETRTVLQAHVNELKTLRSLLPPDLRGKIWILSIERHGVW